MNSNLYQWTFLIDGLIPNQVRLKRKVWLKKDELLLDKKGDKLNAYLLADNSSSFDNDKKLIPYLWFSSLISNSSPHLTGGGGSLISSVDELGTKPVLSTSVNVVIPDEAVSDIENYAHKFLKFIGNLHDRYINLIEENQFLSIALDYFYDANKKSVYEEELISAMISMEALFNENPSDISYKLALRASFLLGLYGIDSLEAYEQLKKFYKHRSKVIHGAGLLSYDSDGWLISRYARQSIIIFLILLSNEKRQQIKKSERKKEILKEIDYAMLDESRRKSMKHEVKKGIKYFDLKIPRVFEGQGKNGKYRTTAW
jgi:hypothetical protein